MHLLRELNELSITAVKMKDILPKSGWCVSKRFSTLMSFHTTPFYLSYTCDLTDAYSNCTLNDIKDATSTLFALVGDSFPLRKFKLISTLLDFVLPNNYILAAKFILVN